MGRKPEVKDSVQISFLVERDTANYLRQLSEQEQCSTAFVLRRLIRERRESSRPLLHQSEGCTCVNESPTQPA